MGAEGQARRERLNAIVEELTADQMRSVIRYMVGFNYPIAAIVIKSAMATWPDDDMVIDDSMLEGGVRNAVRKVNGDDES